MFETRIPSYALTSAVDAARRSIHRGMHRRIVSLLLAFAGTACAQSPAQQALGRGIAHFQAGRIAESVEEFDAVVRLAPGQAPYLWQRGIALYYAGRYRDCREQFESHRTVNPDDVENAAWHFLCVAKAESPERAKAALLPVGPDPRVPMRQVYQMFQGTLDPEQVLAAGDRDVESEFYAHLYVSLYFDALGQAADALEHIRSAAADRYAAAGGYMHMVARVHLAALERGR